MIFCAKCVEQERVRFLSISAVYHWMYATILSDKRRKCDVCGKRRKCVEMKFDIMIDNS